MCSDKGRKKVGQIDKGMRKPDQCREAPGWGQNSYTIVLFWSVDQISIKTPNLNAGFSKNLTSKGTWRLLPARRPSMAPSVAQSTLSLHLFQLLVTAFSCVHFS
jgi:hypothetical protein